MYAPAQVAKVRHIFRFDLDKTYLKTEFDTVRDLVRTARASAEERENIPGAAALIRAIRAQKDPSAESQIYFISGSPEQLRPVIEKKFELDGFSPDGFILKPMVSELFRGRFRTVRGQVAYKLSALLGGRAQAPVGTPETLVGDDAESDVFIYSLYADMVRGRVKPKALEEVLRRSGAYRDQIDVIRHELEGVIHENAVKRILIHLDRHTPPVSFADYAPRVVPIYNHLQTAIVLALDDNLAAAALIPVVKELLTRFDFPEDRLVHLSEDIMRRQRLAYPEDALPRFADLLARAIEDQGESKRRRPEDGSLEVLARVVERARYVASRPRPTGSLAPDTQAHDHVELYERELARRQEAKALQRLGKD